MRKVLVATHASFAQGIKETLDFILGQQDMVNVMCAYIEQDFDIEKEVCQVLESLDCQDELIVLVDLMGGSVSNTFSHHLMDSRLHIISGVNFPMLLDIVLNQDKNIDAVIRSGITAAQQGIVYINEKMKNDIEEEDF